MRGATSAADWLISLLLRTLVFLLVLLLGGALVHAIGHIAALSAFGAHVTRVNVLWLQLVPRLAWSPALGSYGQVQWTGGLTPRETALAQIAGSGATWLVSLLAVASYRFRRRLRASVLRVARLALAGLFLDVLVHTLPAVGVSLYRYIGVGAQQHPSSELYNGAVSLGLPPAVVLGLVFGYPLLAAVLARRAIKSARS